MLIPEINNLALLAIFGSFLTSFAIIWAIAKSLDFLNH